MRPRTRTLPFFQYHILFLSFLLSLLLVHGTQNHLPGNVTDCHALIFFKAQISDDPFGSLISWNETNTTLHFCDWLGVTCGSPLHPERVTALALTSFNLTGTLSPYLANLTFLHSLNLSSNSFHGSIPSDIGRLSHLRYLDLGHNFFEGEIPVSLTHCSKLHTIILQENNLFGKIPVNFSRCQDLNIIRFQHNGLVGTIPQSLGSLANLQQLFLGRNQLEGGIPSSFGNLSSLAYLSLSENNLGGHIPSELGRLSKLKYFTFGMNWLSGEIPASLFNISSIYYFNVGNNNLSGVLPHDFGSALPNLQFVYVFYNQLGGLIPASMSNASGLQKIEFHGNMFTGQVPRNFGSLRNLTLLDVGRNQLETADVDFITSLTNCSSLVVLDISQNNLQGALPSSAVNLSATLSWLRMAGNQISGIIPPGIGRFNRLTYYDLTSNLITGTIPRSIGMLQNLDELHLDGNLLDGEIPTAIGNLTKLSQLVLAENKLKGNIPASIGNLVYLNTLDLSHNMLSGAIPGQALSHLSSLSLYLGLSNNVLTGYLPLQIGSLINLNELDISENRLSGEIPSSLGRCMVLEELFMQGNFFEGVIPSALTALKGIKKLDLSRNKLSGRIPEFFKSYQLLLYLNLSFNDLDGRVPQGRVFSNTSAISVMGNNKLCGGDQALNLKPCDASNRMSNHKSSLHKVVIPIVIAPTLVLLLATAAYLVWKPRKKANPPNPYTMESFLQISYDDIRRATDGFSSSNLIGVGSFGSVYKGIMDSDPNRIVAVKVLNLEQRGAFRSFMAECESLRVIKHRNLVSILTICSSIDIHGNEFKALIFEYMPNGSLDKWLHSRNDEGNANSMSLNLAERWNIVMDVAFSLDYLHHQCQTPIVHCDLKPANVLLDYDMSAHVGDFGLSRFLQRSSSSQDPSSSIGLKGSIGYIAPEYGIGSAVTTKGDVYSYGVLLLETFTGKRPTDNMFQSDLNLHKYVEMAYAERIHEVMDPSITLNDQGNGKSCDRNMYECASSILKIGLLCTKESPDQRMGMGDVVKELLLIKSKFEHVLESSRVRTAMEDDGI